MLNSFYNILKYKNEKNIIRKPLAQQPLILYYLNIILLILT